VVLFLLQLSKWFFTFAHMEYFELDCTVEPAGENTDILIAWLSDIGFSMFEESETGVKAYIEESLYDEAQLKSIPTFDDGVKVTYKVAKMPNVNWNAVWESNFQPVIIGNDIYVRADYHAGDPNFRYELVIQPRMAFGTGHHATTSLVMQAMLKMNFKDQIVLDMGCGTGILAILASMMRAKDILAIDIDENATENTLVNCNRNNIENIRVLTGGASASGNEKFNILLANINRNIILEDLPLYKNNMLPGAFLITSGYYEVDLEVIKKAAADLGLQLLDFSTSDNWCRATFVNESAS
jgi:ribosomal protein L11 methyltransferase